MVKEFENKIAEFFNAPFAVATDSCTHGLELCLRLMNTKIIQVPKRTYLSVPMLAEKLGIQRYWVDLDWKDYYSINQGRIIDAAVYWQKGGYIPGLMMCLSFQYQKHLSLGRGGMILLDNEYDAKELKKMSYDGREPGIPWREQNIKTMGFHYYATPETAELGLKKFPEAARTMPRKWTIEDYPDLTQMDVFKNK